MAGSRAFVLSQIRAQPLIEALERTGATSISLLSEAYRRELLEEAASYEYREAREEVRSGSHVVRQRMGVFDALPPESAFFELTARFQELWDRSMRALSEPPFDAPPLFNDWMLQKYEVGPDGITPHRDRTAYRYVVCLFVLAGRGRFGVCEDRSGRGAVEIENQPGDLILMRAPGFMGSDRRPLHFLRDIEERRYVFGLRHDATKPPNVHQEDRCA